MIPPSRRRPPRPLPTTRTTARWRSSCSPTATSSPANSTPRRRPAARGRSRPGDAEPRFRLGRLLVENGRSSDGARELRRAIELDPEYAAANFELAGGRRARLRALSAPSLSARVRARPDLRRPKRHPEVPRRRQALAALLELWQDERAPPARERRHDSSQPIERAAPEPADGEETSPVPGATTQGGGYARVTGGERTSPSSGGSGGGGTPFGSTDRARGSQSSRPAGDDVIDSNDLRGGAFVNQAVTPGEPAAAGAEARRRRRKGAAASDRASIRSLRTSRASIPTRNRPGGSSRCSCPSTPTALRSLADNAERAAAAAASPPQRRAQSGAARIRRRRSAREPDPRRRASANRSGRRRGRKRDRAKDENPASSPAKRPWSRQRPSPPVRRRAEREARDRDRKADAIVRDPNAALRCEQVSAAGDRADEVGRRRRSRLDEELRRARARWIAPAGPERDARGAVRIGALPPGEKRRHEPAGVDHPLRPAGHALAVDRGGERAARIAAVVDDREVRAGDEPSGALDRRIASRAARPNQSGASASTSRAASGGDEESRGSRIPRRAGRRHLRRSARRRSARRRATRAARAPKRCARRTRP